VPEGILVGIIDASLLRKAMQYCSGVDTTALACSAIRSDACFKLSQPAYKARAIAKGDAYAVSRRERKTVENLRRVIAISANLAIDEGKSITVRGRREQVVTHVIEPA
jgi:hypothetical protein